MPLVWAAFDLVEGVIDHQVLRLHHVGETAPRAARPWWDAGVPAWGTAMAVAGGLLVRGRRSAPPCRGSPWLLPSRPRRRRSGGAMRVRIRSAPRRAAEPALRGQTAS
ncbi:hypothetical protein DA075_16495 [Methylobacterium currus]|uniref:DUF2243 domain-containing protein n=1 Tax=Methylobacterium currus TaxID=2051553 RepID=A0A2R4WL90_9HYPH|nr:hypothetical protein DA075_16495 [Methylobacterium currus]